jgi:hypothetical protein
MPVVILTESVIFLLFVCLHHVKKIKIKVPVKMTM